MFFWSSFELSLNWFYIVLILVNGGRDIKIYIVVRVMEQVVLSW